MNRYPRIAVLGATGAVGQEFIRLFEERMDVAEQVARYKKFQIQLSKIIGIGTFCREKDFCLW